MCKLTCLMLAALRNVGAESGIVDQKVEKGRGGREGKSKSKSKSSEVRATQ